MHVQRMWTTVSFSFDVGSTRAHTHRRASLRLPRRRLQATLRSAQHAFVPRAYALRCGATRLHRLRTSLQTRATARTARARSHRRPPVPMFRLSSCVQHSRSTQGSLQIAQWRASVRVLSRSVSDEFQQHVWTETTRACCSPRSKTIPLYSLRPRFHCPWKPTHAHAHTHR